MDSQQYQLALKIGIFQVQQRLQECSKIVVEFLHFLTREAVDHLVCKIVALDVKHLSLGIFALDLVYYRAHKVSFTESRRAVDKERIIILCIL